MKKLIIALSVVLSMSAMAQEEDKFATCASYSKLAGTIMNNRQQGVEMATMLEVSKPSAAYDIAEILIKAAYLKPRFSLPDYQQNAIIDFKNDVMSECMGR